MPSSLDSLQEFAHLQIPFEDIRSATNNFAHENLIREGGYVHAYKGQLLQSGELINIVARWSGSENPEEVIHEDEFRTEVLMLSRLKHENLVSIVGFCVVDDEGYGVQTVVNKYEVNESLDKYISSPNLTWIQRLKICLGAARALSFLHCHTGRSYDVIHRNIKSSTILLDENWEAKLCGLELSILNLASRRDRLVPCRPHTTCYADPMDAETYTVTHKSDVYSLGVVLFEVLCGRKAMSTENGGCDIAPLAKKHYEDGKLKEIIDPGIVIPMDQESVTIFSKTAYDCLSRNRTDRPTMKTVVKRLEKALKLQNPEQSKTPADGTSSNHSKVKNLEHLKIPLRDIQLATKEFRKNKIGSGAYGEVYKAELNHFDGKSLSEIEGKNEDELCKRRSTVAIKRIFSRQDEQGEHGFLAEIEMLSCCKHRNIVSLLGYCDEGPDQILVYEFAPNGSLADYLENTDMNALTWMQRLKICLDIAHGLDYLHTPTKNKGMIIHRDIKSDNILLFEKWEAKIADFGLSRFHLKSTINTGQLVGTEVYMDPEFVKTGRLKIESDIYSFGVVLFELMCGRLAYDKTYNDEGLASMVRRCFIEGHLEEMVDPKIREEPENKFTLNRGPNQDSLTTFTKIGYQCLAETQAMRPSMKAIIEKLEEALHFQETSTDNLEMSLEDIKLATENFSDNNVIGYTESGKLYKGEVPHANEYKIIAAKRLHGYRQGEVEFLTEVEILYNYKHEKIIGLVGYCHEMDENIIVYEHMSNGILDKHLDSISLTWTKRLEICIDVATGLDFLHGGGVRQEPVMHGNIQSSNILLNGDWKAKICDFGVSEIFPINDKEMNYVLKIAKKSDIYGFGIVLFDILCGELKEYVDDDDPYYRYNYHSRSSVAHNIMRGGKLNKMVFEGIKEQIAPESFTIFQRIVHECLYDEGEKQPTAGMVVLQLKEALKIQEDYEISESKSSADNKQMIQRSNIQETKVDEYSATLTQKYEEDTCTNPPVNPTLWEEVTEKRKKGRLHSVGASMGPRMVLSRSIRSTSVYDGAGPSTNEVEALKAQIEELKQRDEVREQERRVEREAQRAREKEMMAQMQEMHEMMMQMQSTSPSPSL